MPPYYPGLITRQLQAVTPPGSWLLDPFGNDPYILLELARAGYRILVTANNPIPAFILQVLASAPTVEEWGDALLALANLKTSDGQRLEDFITSFYRIHCPKCGTEIEIESFIWAEETVDPAAIVTQCPSCGLSGEIPLTPELITQIKHLPSLALHKSRALELVSGPDDEMRSLMEEVIRYYRPRALILMQILLNKINLQEFSPRQKTLLQALFLTTADRVNQLWAYPLGRNRPRQLITPPKYQEANVWQALVQSREIWQHQDEPVTIREWPALPSLQGGISLFKGRLRELTPRPAPDMIKHIIISLPRRNQAFWNFAGLWTGWLWGREAVSPLHHSLLRQRYDWTWHTKALEKVMIQLHDLVPEQTPVLLNIAELDNMFLMSGLLSANHSGLSLKGLAADGEISILQSHWQVGIPGNISAPQTNLSSLARQSAQAYLAQRGEPSPYPPLLAHVLVDLLIQGALQKQPESQPNGTLNELLVELETAFRDPSLFTRFAPGLSPDSGLYWLKNPPKAYTPLADKVEEAVHAFLDQNLHADWDTILRVTQQQTPGFSTPDRDLLAACLEAYAQQVQPEKPYWMLRSGEDQEIRKKDLQTISTLLQKICQKLHYQYNLESDHMVWSQEEKPAFLIFPMTSGIISPYLIKYSSFPGTKLIVIPGSRSNLVTFKLKRDPNLQALFNENWHFINYRQVRNIANNPLLNQDLFESQLFEDPPEYQLSQLALF